MGHKDPLKMLFPLDLGGVFDSDIAIEGAHLDAVQGRIQDLRGEMHPDTANETLSDWENRYGIIPIDGATIDVRRMVVAQQRRLRGRLDIQYFIDLAAKLGFIADIEEIPPNFGTYGGTPSTIHVWRMHITNSPQTLTFFTAGDSSSGDLLQDWGTEATAVLEAVISAMKPGHTHVYFIYD
jgi:uncharacterized protein YmfQ (DUF2313 family)